MAMLIMHSLLVKGARAVRPAVLAAMETLDVSLLSPAVALQVPPSLRPKTPS